MVQNLQVGGGVTRQPHRDGVHSDTVSVGDGRTVCVRVPGSSVDCVVVTVAVSVGVSVGAIPARVRVAVGVGVAVAVGRADETIVKVSVGVGDDLSAASSPQPLASPLHIRTARMNLTTVSGCACTLSV